MFQTERSVRQTHICSGVLEPIHTHGALIQLISAICSLPDPWSSLLPTSRGFPAWASHPGRGNLSP